MGCYWEAFCGVSGVSSCGVDPVAVIGLPAENVRRYELAHGNTAGCGICFVFIFPFSDMRNSFSHVGGRIVVLVAVSSLSLPICAQVNSWMNPASTNWEDASSWSLGIRPGAGQTIMLTNAGWKAVQIWPPTVQNFPQSLTVNSIVISSPTNGGNELLMNFAGYQ